MPYSSLVFRDLAPETASATATIVPLHGDQGWLDDLVPLARSLGPDCRIVAPEAARGVFDGRHRVVAHTWYASVRLDRPEPASFGDSLAQIERFVHDVAESAHSTETARPWLLGLEQGAVLGLAAAGVIPDLLSGVMAIGGALPEIKDWQPLVAEANGLPILLIADPTDQATPLETSRRSADALRDWGASVTLREIAGAKELGSQVSDVLRDWFVPQVSSR